MASPRGIGIPFFVIGLAFLVLGLTGRQAFLVIGFAFLVLGFVAFARRPRTGS